MRNFGFENNDSADIGTPAILDTLTNMLPAETLRLDEAEREAVADDAISTFRTSSNDDEDESDNNTAKIAGAVLVGLLLVGGSIYAYESATANHAPQTAMLAPAQHQTVAAAQPATPPPAATPDATAPSAASTPKAPVHSAARATATTAASIEPQSNVAPATSTASADPVINQPMTLTPETAPAPQQSAMQQPITAPNVSGQTDEPTPEVANNSGTSSVTLPSATVQPNLTAPADAPAQAPAPSESSPATPAAPAPAPAQ